MSPTPDPSLRPIVRVAPAKINLTLSIGARRGDGYHDLHSVMVPTSLVDRLSLAPAHESNDTLHVTGDDDPPRPDDLVLRGIAAARSAVRAELGPAAETFALAARLEKRIPLAAGLAGGSGDAAAALDGAIEAWGVDLSQEARIAAAAGVGSDVPFFLAGGPALVEGRGERVTPLRLPLGPPIGILLVSPKVRVSTAEAFKRLDADGGAALSDRRSTRLTSEHLAQELGGGLSGADLVARAGVLAIANDLVPATAALLPELRMLRRGLARLLARPVGQSGSGPTLWALYPSPRAAEEAAATVWTAVDDARLVTPGNAGLTIHATTIAGPGSASTPGRNP